MKRVACSPVGPRQATFSGIFRFALLVLFALAVGMPAWARGPAPLETVGAAQLPVEAQATLAAIRRGGPYRYRQDDSEFGNRERRLPPEARGFYREYTVPTPGSRDRGARRIIAGGNPPTVFYYTDDHYRSFRQIRD